MQSISGFDHRFVHNPATCKLMGTARRAPTPEAIPLTNQMDQTMIKAVYPLDHRFVRKDTTTSLQDLKGFEYDYLWLKHTSYTLHIPYGILEDGRNDDQGPFVDL